MSSTMEKNSRLRREKDILDRIENVKRLIMMENTLLTADGITMYSRYALTDRDGKRIGNMSMLQDLRDEIQLQLLSIVALCYGENPDIGEPVPMLEWEAGMQDEFRDMWAKCLHWNA